MDKIYRKIINDKVNIFIITSLLGIVLFLLWLVIIGDSQPVKWLVMEHNHDWQFSDFFRQIIYASDLKNIYFNTTDVPFPPLAYLIFNLIYRINPKEYDISALEWKKAAEDNINMVIFIIIELINIIILYLIINKYLKKYNYKKSIAFYICISLSAPFLAGAIERGNTALFVLTLILVSLYYKDSVNKHKKHLSLILLAIAIGFKIYPIIFILLWIKEKRYKEIKIFGIYFIIFVLLPFAFTGGIEGFFKYCDNLLINFSGKSVVLWTSIEGFYFSTCKALNILAYSIVPMIIKYVFLIVNIGLAFLTKDKRKVLIPFAILMAVFTSISYRYTSIYMLIPLLFIISSQNKENKKIDIVYTILFGMIFTIPVWAFWFEVDFAIYIMIYILDIIWIIESFKMIPKSLSPLTK